MEKKNAASLRNTQKSCFPAPSSPLYLPADTVLTFCPVPIRALSLKRKTQRFDRQLHAFTVNPGPACIMVEIILPDS